MSDGFLCGSVALASVADPVTAATDVYAQFGYQGLIILFLVVVWLDGKKREKQVHEDEKARAAREEARMKELNNTLGELKTLIGMLLQRHGGGDE